MVADANFGNAFATDGIDPAPYGHRTIVEYRARTLSLPVVEDPISQARENNQSSVPGQEEDQVTPVEGENEDETLAPRDDNGNLHVPNIEDVEGAKDWIQNNLEMDAIGRLDRRYLACLRVDRPMWIAGRVRGGRAERQPKGNRLSKWWRGEIGSSVHRALIDWHWGEPVLSVATGAHLDRVCVFNMSGYWESNPERQREIGEISCIAFRPYTGRVLAIGCVEGIVLMKWNGFRLLGLGKGHRDVISLDWSEDGRRLATASREDGRVRIWQVSTESYMVVDRGSFVKFGRGNCAKYLFIASEVGNFFRLWCTETWKCERWGYLSGNVSAAVWSPTGSTLLFATEGESAIHVLNVGQIGIDESTRVVHTELTSLPKKGPGGTPIMLEMDHRGARLAVIYETPSEMADDIDCDPNGRYAVALYATQLEPNFRMNPVGYISGPGKSGPPVGIKFRPCYGVETGTVLCTMWRSGDISFTQLLYDPMPKQR